jgi:hypothetical protein
MDTRMTIATTNDAIELSLRRIRGNLNEHRSFLVATVRRMSSLVGEGRDALENEISTG